MALTSRRLLLARTEGRALQKIKRQTDGESSRGERVGGGSSSGEGQAAPPGSGGWRGPDPALEGTKGDAAETGAEMEERE